MIEERTSLTKERCDERSDGIALSKIVIKIVNEKDDLAHLVQPPDCRPLSPPEFSPPWLPPHVLLAFLRMTVRERSWRTFCLTTVGEI